MRAFIEQLAGPQVKQENKTVRPQDRRGQHSDKSGGQHPGLLLQRYLCENATGDGGNPEEKRAILQAAINAAKNADVQSLYRAAFARWSKSLPNDPAPVDLATQGRLIVGLGTENVLETGIRLHHTYGMPIIPGSALKGLAAHYCDQVWGERDNSNPSDEAIQFRSPRKEDRKNDCEAEPQGEYHNLLFGATDESGYVIFHDAWLVPDSDKEPLKLDVMTPHHSGWNDIKNPEPPTDFDSPVPVPFLSVTGTFCVAVSWHGPAHNQALNWTELALALLRDALFDWGVGGKTSSGYGRFRLPPPPPPPKKRDSNDRARVKIIATRPKGGFDVQDVEPGRSRGTLTVGTPPPGTDTLPGAIAEVLVHNDETKRPQYKWPQQPKK